MQLTAKTALPGRYRVRPSRNGRVMLGFDVRATFKHFHQVRSGQVREGQEREGKGGLDYDEIMTQVERAEPPTHLCDEQVA